MQVYLIDNISNQKRESIAQMHAICLLRPTEACLPHER